MLLNFVLTHMKTLSYILMFFDDRILRKKTIL